MTQLSDTIEPPVDEAGATGEPGASTNLFDHFDGVGTTEPADGATVAPPVDEAAEAQAGRERAAASASAIRPQTNYYDQFDFDHDAGEVSLEERMRLSAKDGYYRGTIVGAAELRRLAQAGRDSGWPADIKQQYENIVADLIRHDLLRPPSTPAEAAAVSSGQILAGASQANMGRALSWLWQIIGRALRRLPGDVTPNDPSLRMPRDVPRSETPADDPAPRTPADEAAPPAHTPPPPDPSAGASPGGTTVPGGPGTTTAPIPSSAASHPSFISPPPGGDHAGLAARIKLWVAGARSITNRKVSIDLGEVENADALRSAGKLPFDVTGFRHTIDNSAVRHAYNRHGADPLPVTADDFALVPEILRAPDKVEPGSPQHGLPAIVYSKRFNGVTVYVEEVRGGQKELAMVTIYKKPSKKP